MSLSSTPNSAIFIGGKYSTVPSLTKFDSVAEFIDPVFAKTAPKHSFSLIENERFGLVFAKTGAINSGTGLQRWA
jgi:hypothetical protein